MPRLFVAIDIPEAHRAALSKLVGKNLFGAKWVPEEQLHLTLRFIGEVDDATSSCIQKALAAVKAPCFPLSLVGLGHFPPGKHPRVLWVGLNPCLPLLELQKEVELSLIDAGVAPDDRRFSPHITLARLHDTPFSKIAELEASPTGVPQDPFLVSEFALYSSVLTNRGAIHTREAVYRCNKT